MPQHATAWAETGLLNYVKIRIPHAVFYPFLYHHDKKQTLITDPIIESNHISYYCEIHEKRSVDARLASTDL